MIAITPADQARELAAMQTDFFGKKARARRAAKKESRHERKVEKMNLRTDRQIMRAQSGGGLGNILEKAGGIAANVFGGMKGAAGDMLGNAMGGAALNADPGMDPNMAPPEEKSNTMLFVVIGIVVVGVIIYFVTKKK